MPVADLVDDGCRGVAGSEEDVSNRPVQVRVALSLR